MKNGIYFIVIPVAVVVAELFKIIYWFMQICDVTMSTQNDAKYHNMEYQSLGLKFCRVDMHQELHIMIVIMMSP